MLNAITILGALVLEHEGNWEEIYEHVKSKAKPNKECLEQAEYELKELEEQGYNNLCLVDADYPQILKQLEKPPFIISIKEKNTIKGGQIRLSKDIIVHLGYTQEEVYLEQILKLVIIKEE